jgi:uncharacterized protein (TIRG00374 family)
MALTSDHPVPPDPPVISPEAGVAGRVWRWARYVLGLALAGVAIWAVLGKSDELSGATTALAHLRWAWLAPALVAEVASYLSFASMQRRLLAAGGIDIPIGPMTGITYAGNSIQNSLPAGLVLASAYNFRQYRRWGADDILSAWVVVAMAAVSMLAITGLAAVGLGLAASTGSALDLVTAIVGVAVFAVALVVLWAKRAFLITHAERGVRISQRLVHRPGGDPHQVVEAVLGRLSAVAPSRAQWAWATTFALGNWVCDMSCLALSFLAVGAGIPWDGLLLAYAAAQLATNLPVTPGGLGVVEGSLTVALVAFGGAQASTVAAVLLYRVLSFWLMLPVGWGAWGVLAWAGHRRPVVGSPGRPAPKPVPATVDPTGGGQRR